MLLLMTLYELMKQFFDLDIIIWQSPVIDIIFSSFIAGIVVHLVSKNKLYQSGDMSSLDYADYIKDLAAALADNHCVARNMPTLDIDVNVRLLDDNTLVSCSLLLSELISNSIKHAFADGRKGTITIYLCQNTNGDYILVFSDNGVGLPEGFNVKTVETPGMRLINDLITKRLHGTIELDGTNGTTFKICWNDDFTRHSTTNHERREVSYASCAKNWSYYYA